MKSIESIKYWQDTQVPWDCYRSGNLVYFRHFKCATTTYLGLFDDKLQWEHTNTQQINWEKDKIVSEICSLISVRMLYRNEGIRSHMPFTFFSNKTEVVTKTLASPLLSLW